MVNWQSRETLTGSLLNETIRHGKRKNLQVPWNSWWILHQKRNFKWGRLHSSGGAFRPCASKVVIMACKWCVGWHFFHYSDNVANERRRERLLNDWKPVGAAQEDGDADLSLPRCFISVTQPTSVFIYFCPSSGVNKTPCCRRRARVMRLVPLKALHPAGHGSTSETRGKWVPCLRHLFIWHFYVNVCTSVCVCVVL